MTSLRRTVSGSFQVVLCALLIPHSSSTNESSDEYYRSLRSVIVSLLQASDQHQSSLPFLIILESLITKGMIFTQLFRVAVVALSASLLVSASSSIHSRGTKPRKYRREFEIQAISKTWFKSPEQALEDVEDALTDFSLEQCLLSGSADGGGGPCNGMPWWKHPWDSYHRWCTTVHFEFDSNPVTPEGQTCLSGLDQGLVELFGTLQKEFQDNTTLTWITKPQYPTDAAFASFTITLTNSDNVYDDTLMFDSRGDEDDDGFPFGPFEACAEKVTDELIQRLTEHGYNKDSVAYQFIEPPNNPTSCVFIIAEVYSGESNTAADVRDIVLDTLYSFQNKDFTISNITMEEETGFINGAFKEE